jgi:hypothetical protein
LARTQSFYSLGKHHGAGHSSHLRGCPAADFSLLVLITPQFYDVFFIFLEVLGMEPRALGMLGNCFTIKLSPQPSVIFFIDKVF